MKDIEAQQPAVKVEDTWRGRRPERSSHENRRRGSASRSLSISRASMESRNGPRVVEPKVVLPTFYRTVSIGVDETITNRANKTTASDRNKIAERFAEIEWHTLDSVAVCQQFDVSKEHGLTAEQVQTNLQIFGYNSHTAPPSRILHRLFMYFFGGFGSLLMTGGILCCVSWKPLGNPEPSAANLALGVVLFLVFFIQAGFNAWQDWSSSRVMASISNMVPEDSLALRGGKTIQISTKELVPGDIVFIKPGVKIPADMRLLEVSSDLKFDRAVLTGESKPIPGVSEAADIGSNYLEVGCIALQGSFCVSGVATAIVVGTGDNTVFGSIAKLSSAPKKGLSPMQNEIMRFVFMVIGFVVTIIAVVVAVWGGWVRLKHPEWLPVHTLIVDCVSVAVAFIPEGLPIALTTCLTITANVMRKNNILCKSLAVVETLGSVSVICSDKTGTLTKNQMHATDFSIGSRGYKVGNTEADPKCVEQLQQVAGLCNAAQFASQNHTENDQIHGDATDQALLRYADAVSSVDELRSKWSQVYELAFNSKNKFMIRIMTPEGTTEKPDWTLFIKGAPDILLARCSRCLDGEGNVTEMSNGHRRQVSILQKKWSLEGKRVILLAKKTVLHPENYGEPTSNNFAFTALEEAKYGLTLVGLIGISDPPKDEIPEVIETLRGAGIRIAMVTGDFELTAVSIARQCGIVTSRHEDVDTAANLDLDYEILENDTRIPFSDYIDRAIVLTGAEMMMLNMNQWENLCMYKEVVFARTTPEQKLRIVKEFQARKHIVGMTGDGVNDAPSLKAADVGIAMGNGSDVAIEASDLVLLDSFSSMVQALKYGRLVFENLKKTIIYLLPAGTYSELFPVLLNVFAGLPQVLSSFLMIVICCLTDCAGAITLAYEAPERDLLKRKPRILTGERLVNVKLLVHAYLIMGTIECLTSMAMSFWYFQRQGVPFDKLSLSFGDVPGVSEDFVNETNNRASSIYFINLVVIQFFNLMSTRTRYLSMFQHPPLFNKATQNYFCFIAIAFAICVAFFFNYIPWFQQVLGTRTIPVEYFFLPAAFGLFLVLFDELRKYCCRNYPKSIVAKCSW